MGLKVSKQSFVYKVAYGAAVTCKGPDKGNLCDLFWKTLFMMFVGWPLYGVLWLVAAAFGFLFSYHPTRQFLQMRREKDGGDPDWMAQFKRWPKVRGRRIWPGFVLGSGMILWLLGVATYNNPKTVLAILSIVCLYAVGMGASWIIGSLCDGAKRSWNSAGPHSTGMWNLLIAWLKAKKQKACPLIEFTD